MGRASQDFRDNIAARLASLRQQRGISLRDLSQATAVSLAFLCDLENGKRQPSAMTLLALSRYYDVSIDWIVTGKE